MVGRVFGRQIMGLGALYRAYQMSVLRVGKGRRPARVVGQLAIRHPCMPGLLVAAWAAVKVAVRSNWALLFRLDLKKGAGHLACHFHT
jgi:hypothetical protein